jgi:hypothetical protein
MKKYLTNKHTSSRSPNPHQAVPKLPRPKKPARKKTKPNYEHHQERIGSMIKSY